MSVPFYKKALASVAGLLAFIGLVSHPGGMLTGIAIGVVMVTCAWPWFLELAASVHAKNEAAKAAEMARTAAAKAAASSKLAQANATLPEPVPATPPVRAPLQPTSERQEPAMVQVVADEPAAKRVRKAPKPRTPADPLVWPDVMLDEPFQRASGLAMPPD